MNLYKIIYSNTHSQTGVWERRRSPVGCDCYRTIYTTFKMRFQSLFMPIVGAIAIAPYGFFKTLKYYNLIYFSQKLFFNVKMLKNMKRCL